jgi:hypothetical protein
MPFARIITSTPALAKDVARALRASGYKVEIVSPENVSSTPVDLEIDLDLQNGVAWHPDQAHASVETEYDYDPDAPVEREFILAPAWRKLTAYLRQNWERVRPRRAETLITDFNEVPPPEPIEPANSPALNIIELPIAPRRQGPSILATTIAKCREQLAIAAASARSLTSKMAMSGMAISKAAMLKMEANRASVAPSRSAQARARVQQLMTAFAARKHQPVAVTRTENTTDLKPARDFYLVRQLWPVAAGAVLAFLLGWTAATYNKLPAQTVAQPAATVSHASVTLYSQLGAKARAKQQRVHAVPAKPKPSAVRTVSNTSAVDDEVLVRHYPAKAVTAKTQPASQGPKRYSDLQ